MSGGMPQFHTPDFAPQIAWLAVSFAVLYNVVKHLILPSLDRALLSRQALIENSIRDAEDMQREVGRLTAEADALRAAAAVRAGSLTDRVRVEAARESIVRTAALERELALELDAALQEVHLMHARVQAEVASVIDEVVAALCTRLDLPAARGAA